MMESYVQVLVYILMYEYFIHFFIKNPFPPRVVYVIKAVDLTGLVYCNQNECPEEEGRYSTIIEDQGKPVIKMRLC